MKQDAHYIDDMFADGLGDFEITPPKSVWLAIERKLDRKSHIRMLGIYSGIAASMAILLTVGYTHFSIETNKINQIAQTEKITPSTIPDKVNSSSSLPNLQNRERDRSVNLAEKTDPNKTVALATRHQSTAIFTSPVVDKASTAKNTAVVITKEESLDITIASNPAVSEQKNVITDSTEDAKAVETASNVQPINNIQSDIKYPTEYYSIQPEVAKVITPESNKWSVECQVAPLYSFRNIERVKTDLPGKDGFNSNEQGMVTYAGGFKVNYQTNKRLSVQAGVYYSTMGQSVSNDIYGNTNVVFAQANPEAPQKIITNNSYGAVSTDMDTRSAPVTASEVEDSKIIQQFKYIELPVLARFKIIDKRIGCHLVGGVSTNFLVNNSSYYEQNGSKQDAGATPDIRTLNYSSTLGFGVNYKIFEKLNLSLEPTYKYYLNSISTNSNIKVHPYTFGVFTGLVYSF